MSDPTSVLELMVRSAIPEEFGVFETNQRDLPGTPDIVFRDKKLVVFVHGCYWHRHQNCSLATPPTGDIQRWLRTFNTTVRRDHDALINLRSVGWQCLVFWECDVTSRLEDLIEELGQALSVS
jgi:DNA mismatch endonuclease (patch repair protein)